MGEPSLTDAERQDLQTLVRRRLLQGTLDPATWKCWPTSPSGRLCLICDQPIVEPELDYEIAGAPRHHAHRSCYRIWVEESSALAQSARPTSGESLRLRLIHGLLFPPTGPIWGGPATGKPCVVCSE